MTTRTLPNWPLALGRALTRSEAGQAYRNVVAADRDCAEWEATIGHPMIVAEPVDTFHDVGWVLVRDCASARIVGADPARRQILLNGRLTEWDEDDIPDRGISAIADWLNEHTSGPRHIGGDDSLSDAWYLLCFVERNWDMLRRICSKEGWMS